MITKNIKLINVLPSLVLLLVLLIGCQGNEKSNLTLLSDKTPTDSALVFGQGIISTENYEFAITFSPEMDEMFFTRRKPEERNNIYTTKLVNGKWSEPELAFFSADTIWDFEPHINPKGDVLYFGTSKQLNDTTAPSGLHEWFVKKDGNGWGNPRPMGKPFLDRFMMYLTSSENGNLYFTAEELGSKPEDELYIYYAINQDGRYENFVKMGKEINTGSMIAHPYIAPDESYMIFDGKRSSGFGDCDLYISFNKNGVWSEAYNMGAEINTTECEMTASVSPDGKYLFFHRSTGDSGNIYWIEFEPIKEKFEKNLNSN